MINRIKAAWAALRGKPIPIDQYQRMIDHLERATESLDRAAVLIQAELESQPHSVSEWMNYHANLIEKTNLPLAAAPIAQALVDRFREAALLAARGSVAEMRAKILGDAPPRPATYDQRHQAVLSLLEEMKGGVCRTPVMVFIQDLMVMAYFQEGVAADAVEFYGDRIRNHRMVPPSDITATEGPSTPRRRRVPRLSAGKNLEKKD